MKLEFWTKGQEASLGEILDAREKRGEIQREFLEQQGTSLISFTLNIPGPVKVFPFAGWLLEIGDRLIRRMVKEERGEILQSRENRENTGLEGFYLLNLPPEKVKRNLTVAEEKHPLGRLFDFDVLDRRGEKVSRQELGFPERKCLICGGPAFLCSRSRKHSAEEVFRREVQMMENFYIERMASHMGLLMQKALLYEVNTTLKPGLVDRIHNGAHRDMDLMTFADSAYALTPYFVSCAREGLEFAEEREELPNLFERLRILGREGEKAMKKAAKGTNPHKGMIFSGGILCCCAGYIAGRPENDFRNEDFPRILGEISRKLTENLMGDYKELKKRAPETHGEKLYIRYGIKGIRGEASRGFPHVLEHGLFYLEKLREEGYSMNEAGLLTLLQYISSVEDTNMIIRSDYDTVLRIQEKLKIFLETAGYREQLEMLPDLDAYFVKKNISPGGSADMLALTYFLYFLRNIPCPFEAFDIERRE